MRKYKCSCGKLLNSLGSVREHVKYHKKYATNYAESYSIYRLTLRTRLMFFICNNLDGIIKSIGYIIIFATIMCHDKSYSILETALIALGIGIIF